MPGEEPHRGPDDSPMVLLRRDQRLDQRAQLLRGPVVRLERMGAEGHFQPPKDPLEVLPPEAVRTVLALLPPADLSTLWAVSRGWRAAAGDEALWRDAVVRVDAVTPAASLRILRRAPCLAAVEFSGPADSARSYQAFLRKAVEALEHVRVRKLRGLVASYDMAAAARLLGSEAASAHLEELEMKLPTSERAGQLLRGLRALRVLHLDKGCALRLRIGELPRQLEELRLESHGPLLAFHALPRLHSLWLKYGGPFGEMPPLPDGHCGLRRLAVFMDPADEAALLALLSVHAATLRELCLVRNTAPGSCFYFAGLAAKLGRCGLAALELVVLRECYHSFPADEVLCRRDVQELRDALRRPAAEVAVLCTACHADTLADIMRTRPIWGLDKDYCD